MATEEAPQPSEGAHVDRLRASVTDTLVDESVTPPPAVDDSEPVGLERGAMVGRYVVLSTLGAGAMGVVYAAYDPELDRKVALKLLDVTRQGGSSQGRSRLLREAQAMAKLSHPNVITVHDVGVHDDQVFFAMELVEGTTLRTWMGEGDRPWRELLDVMVLAGRGLAAAHTAGLVHRDFKPDNVLVGRDGRVCVTDFGIARAATASRDDETDASLAVDSRVRPREGALSLELTRPGTVAGTPAYMAPEQFLGLVVDTRGDQFSFCATAWQALYGERPFAGETVTELALSVTRGKLREPAHPARAPAWVRRVLTRGLFVDPQARYPSMDELLGELARDPARNRRRAVGVLAVAGVAAAFGYWAQSAPEPCAGAGEKLVGVWDDARRERVGQAIVGSGVPYASDTWERVRTRLDGYAEAWTRAHVDACEATHVRNEQSAELLDLRVVCLGRSLAGLGALVDVLERADAAVVERAVQASAQLGALDRCADAEMLLRGVPPPSDPTIAATTEDLRTRLGRLEALENAGKFKDALGAVEPLLEEARATSYAPLIAEVLERRGVLLERVGRFDDSAASLKEAYFGALRNRHDEVATAAASTLVFVIGHRGGRPDEGLVWADHADAMVGRIGGETIERAALLKYVGNLHHRKGDLPRARDHYERALSLTETVRGPDHPDVAVGHVSLASALVDLGERDAARRHYEQALELMRSSLGPGHPDVGMALNGLGNVAYYGHDREQARRYYEEALAIWQSALGGEHPAVATALTNLGNVLDELGEIEQARANYQRAVATGERVLGPTHPDVALALINLGLLREKIGEIAEARGDLARALAIREKAFGPDTPPVANALVALARVQNRLGDRAQALEMAERALTIRVSALGAEHAKTAEARGVVGRIHLDAGRRTEAGESLERVLAACARTSCEDRIVKQAKAALDELRAQ